ncbi:hypothetical protein HUT19_21770 [Streptomyces sp. NA02950]|uniref:hypothetical protein n=1 Tax=Streptomyces sp. NA02950 TaxID=2742137 RepID=UPI0015929C3D|nr:hypothetical protein [Streptomyces sp. NA02950]QKV94062.1 hypothetical protein HUT19_21770 [Streptomyces sp. NA02950]
MPAGYRRGCAIHAAASTSGTATTFGIATTSTATVADGSSGMSGSTGTLIATAPPQGPGLGGARWRARP